MKIHPYVSLRLFCVKHFEWPVCEYILHSDKLYWLSWMQVFCFKWKIPTEHKYFVSNAQMNLRQLGGLSQSRQFCGLRAVTMTHAELVSRIFTPSLLWFFCSLNEIGKRRDRNGKEGHGKSSTTLTVPLLKLETCFSAQMRSELVSSHSRYSSLLMSYRNWTWNQDKIIFTCMIVGNFLFLRD